MFQETQLKCYKCSRPTLEFIYWKRVRFWEIAGEGDDRKMILMASPHYNKEFG